jgi:purine nucleosidase
MITGLDDYLALLLLLRHHIGAKADINDPDTIEREYGKLRVLGITVTPAICLPDVGLRLTQKLLSLCLFSCRVPVAESTLALPQPFPESWRTAATAVDALPLFTCTATEPGEAAPLGAHSGQEQLAQSLLAAQKPVTLLMTGPLTNLAWALDHYPAVADHIEEVVIMGGALAVPGNVAAVPAAEWNFHCDAAAAARVWQSALPLTLVPLDVINAAPITADLLQRLQPQHTQQQQQPAKHTYTYASLAIAAWLAAAVPSTKPVYAYDLVAAAYVVKPALFAEPQQLLCGVVADGPTAGTLERRAEGAIGSRSVKVSAVSDQLYYTLYHFNELSGALRSDSKY